MQKRFEIGQIVNTFGIKGEAKVVPFTDDITRFDDLKKVYVRNKKSEQLYKVESVRYHKNSRSFRGPQTNLESKRYKKRPESIGFLIVF